MYGLIMDNFRLPVRYSAALSLESGRDFLFFHLLEYSRHALGQNNCTGLLTTALLYLLLSKGTRCFNSLYA